jgi:DNA mismatch repair ATPase MutS
MMLSGFWTASFPLLHSGKASILEGSYRNVHFQEAITNSGILFDYRLRDGRATSRNAIKLLQLMGYSAAIVEEAEKRADGFVSRGSWKEISRQ